MINFNNSKFFSKPFVHCVFEEIFLEKDYNSLVENFPSLDQMEKMYDPKGENKFNKFQLSSRNHSKKFNKVMMKNKFYKKVTDYLLSDFFLENLVNNLKKQNIEFGVTFRKNSYKRKFFDVIKNFLPGFILKPKEVLNVVVEFSAIPSNQGYLKPHSDGPAKLASIVIPIRDEKWKDEYNGGTNLLEPRDEKRVFNVKNNTLEFEETKIIKVIDFKKNQMLIFPKTFNSLHSVGPLKGLDKNYYRKSLTLNLEKKIII